MSSQRAESNSLRHPRTKNIKRSMTAEMLAIIESPMLPEPYNEPIEATEKDGS